MSDEAEPQDDVDPTAEDPADFVDEATKKTVADKIVELALSSAKLFRTPDSVAFADVAISGHRETWPVLGAGFRRWLRKVYYDATGKSPAGEPMKQALGVLEAQAIYGIDEREVFLRVASASGKSYLDLCDDAWRAIEIDADGWRIVTDPPVRFRRSRGMLPLPVPVKGGRTFDLRRFLNLRSDESWQLILAWLRASLRDRGPFAIMVFLGEHGTFKSTSCRMLRSLIDPNKVPVRALSREERDLYVTALHSHVLACDNVSDLPQWLSDALCRLATGGGFATRALYTDDDEIIFAAMRPIVLNGITAMTTRPDLADRCIFIPLNPVPRLKRRREAELWAEFEQARPKILGALLDDISRGLRQLPTVKFERGLPRMADFAYWAAACEPPALRGKFEKAYEKNRAGANEELLSSDPVATELRMLMEKLSPEPWEGNMSALLGELTSRAGEKVAKSKEWPSDGARLSRRLTRLAPSLRDIGITIERRRDGASRTTVIRLSEEGGKTASSASPASLPNKNNRVAVTPSGDASVIADSGSVIPRVSVIPSVTPKPLELKNNDAGDAGDAKSRPFSDTRPRPPRRDRKPLARTSTAGDPQPKKQFPYYD